MKRIICVFTVLCMLLLAGCGASTEEIAALREQVAVLEYRVEQLEKGLSAPSAPMQAPVATHAPIPESVAIPQDAGAFSTIDEVRAYFDGRFPELMMSAHMISDEMDYAWLGSGQQSYEAEPPSMIGRADVVHAATFLLQSKMDIATLIAFRSDENGGMPMLSLNCIKTDRGYRFVDPVFGMRGDEGSRFGAQLPEAQTESVEAYIELIKADPFLMAEIDNIYLIRDTGEIRFQERADGYAELISDGELIYHNEGALTDEQYTAHIKPENIGSYRLSRMLGGVTLTPAEAYALVDASPEEAQKRIRTAADVLMYMLAAQTADCGGCFCEQSGGYTWHYNLTAKQVMEKKEANCGACANLANYLLAGDYEEVGIIQHAYYPGNGGGHVYNYFLYEGKYYIVDLSWYIFSNYAPTKDFRVMELSSLEEYGSRVHELYGGVSLILALTSTGQHLPNIFGEDFGDSHYYVPTGSEYTVLFEAGDGYRIGEMPLDKNFHDWTKYW